MSAQNDSAFIRMFLLVLGALVAFTILILFVANEVAASTDEAGDNDPRLRAAIAERIAPIGRVKIAPAPAPAPAPAVASERAAPAPAPSAAPPAAAEPAVSALAPAEPAVATVAQAKPAVVPAPATAAPATSAPARSGEAVSNAACNACHLLGVLGAPKVGDGDAWRPRLAAAGIDGLVHSAINGKGNMPARGGAKVTDAEIRAAVEYMLSASGVDFDAVTDAAPASADEPPASAPSETPAAAAPDTTSPAMVASADTAATAPAAPTTPAAEVDLAKGKTIYDTACFACHATGAAGAPKLGDQALWAPRIAKGMEALNHNAVNGVGAMPAKGGRVDLADADIASAVAYMVEQAK